MATENFQRLASLYQLLQRKLSGDLGGLTLDSDEDYEDSDPGNDCEDEKGDYNEILTPYTGSNTAPYHLGCGQGATGALFYLVKYLTKSGDLSKKKKLNLLVLDEISFCSTQLLHHIDRRLQIF